MVACDPISAIHPVTINWRISLRAEKNETHHGDLCCRVPDLAAHRRLGDRDPGQAFAHAIYCGISRRRVDAECISVAQPLAARPWPTSKLAYSRRHPDCLLARIGV